MKDDRGPLKVLIIEDNRADAFLLTMILRDLGLGLTIDVARDGQAALDILAEAILGPETAPDLVILDLNLPRVHGYEVLSFIRSGPLRSVPVTVMTGSLNKEDEARSLRLGATYYLTKPSTLPEIDMVSTFLRTELRKAGREGKDEGGTEAPAGPKNGMSGHARCALGDRLPLSFGSGLSTGTAIYPYGLLR